jgi:predicted oxidoreductase
MEGLYLRNNIELLIKYYNLTNNKTKDDINQLLLKSNKGIALTQKELDRIKKYIFRYKMIMESVSINTDTRLNKLTRKPLTIPSKDFI